MSKKSSSNIDWVIKQLERSREYPEKYVRTKNFINQKTLFACPRCRCAWEYIKREKRVDIYDDFPTIGLEKKVCERCQNKIEK